ncbi:MAG: glycosyltransferase [Candidatus Lokiarchaeota archaeon]|nr:glycosyltransferase [Candidatus Lokiarchaeota archaeon]
MIICESCGNIINYRDADTITVSTCSSCKKQSFSGKQMNEICIIGHPSLLGGADTELDHQIRIWQELGLKVYILPVAPLDQNQKNMEMEKRGCTYLSPRGWHECKDMVVISYCNGEFLANIEAIKHYARCVIWVNCMTWLFDKEKEAHKNGFIDWFIYQTDHARERVHQDLLRINTNFNWAKVQPYFYAGEFPFVPERPKDKFRFGRISRPDTDKFSSYQKWIYETMTAPVLKEGKILGIDHRAIEKIGELPNWIKGHPAGEISAQELYKFSECIIQACDTYENFPRIGFEAMSSGSLLIVDDRGGWREQVQHKQTGFLCKSDREFVYYSTRAAFEEKERKIMIQNARDWLDTNWGIKKAKEEWSKFFAKVEKT